jgi:hypothetical protein
MLYWSKDILNFIILMSMHFLPMQICSHYLLTCFLCVLFGGNMKIFQEFVPKYAPLHAMAIVAIVANHPSGDLP